MKCDNCLSKDTYIKDYEHKYLIRGKEIIFSSPRRFCKECNNLVYDEELDDQAIKFSFELYNQKYGIVKEKIKELRTMYNLSQSQFSKIIGCAKKTLISYEKGTALPNDNYVIIINSLLEKPATIDLLIKANKYQFSEEEYKTITEKIMTFIANNIPEVENDDITELTEFNGYQNKNKNKIKNIILFFAEQGVLKTKLLKEMFYADFLYYKEHCVSITGLEYVKITYGPVPESKDNILNELICEEEIKEEIEYNGNYESHNIISLEKFDESIFDKEELEILNKVKDYFKDFKSKEIADFSHEEKGYIETEFSKNISYDYAFDIERIV